MVIVKNGHRICGTGAALASAPVVQNKAYFEVKVQQTGKVFNLDDSDVFLTTPVHSVIRFMGRGPGNVTRRPK